MQADLFAWRKPERPKYRPIPPQPSGPHFEAVSLWSRLWKQTRGEKFTWTERDLAAIRHILKVSNGITDALIDRMQRLLCDPPDRWYAQNASPRLLYSRWNELGHSVKVRPLSERNLDTLRRAALEL